MADHQKARVVPFSSVVGSSVTLHAPTGEVIGQLGIMNVGGTTPEDWKQRSIAIADDIAKRINCHDDLVAALKAFAAIHDHDRGTWGLGALHDAEALAVDALAKAGAAS